MPYYCTVPRCTSMAGKAKNVSFHQFPRDEELAKLWNRILKRGKPYTKYSKVCSLHFRQEDYTINSVGKKGQWRSLRKDAIPSQNLPSESPLPQQRRSSCGSQPSLPPSLMDPQIQQQFAQAIYVQTMLAMQAATFRDNQESMDLRVQQNDSRSNSDCSRGNRTPSPNPLNLTPNGDLQNFLNTYSKINIHNEQTYKSYKCPECPKYFKDPDVYILHKRKHEKTSLNQEMLSSNPILANLLKPKVPSESDVNRLNAEVSEVNRFNAEVNSLNGEISEVNRFNDDISDEGINRLNAEISDDGVNSLNAEISDREVNEREMATLSIDKIAMALTMEAYVRNLSAFKAETSEVSEDLNESGGSNRLVIDETF